MTVKLLGQLRLTILIAEEERLLVNLPLTGFLLAGAKSKRLLGAGAMLSLITTGSSAGVFIAQPARSTNGSNTTGLNLALFTLLTL